MFHTPKNALFSRVSRRKFLELGGGAATALGAGSLALGPGLDDHPLARPGPVVRRCEVEAVCRLEARLHVGKHAAVLRHSRQYQDVLRSHRHRCDDPDRRPSGRAAEGRHRSARRQGRLRAQLRAGQADRRAVRRILCRHDAALRRRHAAAGSGRLWRRRLVRELPVGLRPLLQGRQDRRAPL